MFGNRHPGQSPLFLSYMGKNMYNRLSHRRKAKHQNHCFMTLANALPPPALYVALTR